MSTDILTRSFDFSRSGANITETVLTPQAVATRGVKKLLTLDIPDDPRLEAQPLYVSNLSVGDQTRNVIIQATMGNWIYAWDAATGAILRKNNLGVPITGTQDIDAHMVNVKWGILSTPVIDRSAGRLYTCAWISTDETGNWQTGQFFAAALDITTGHLVDQLLSLEGVTYNPGQGLPTLLFRSIERKQRSALALVNGAVIICFGTIAETAANARGWVIAIDTATWSISAVWCSTCRGSGGGIWMSGGGPAIQSDGSIWVVTGNGDFDGQFDFGESVVRLSYTPPSAHAAGSLAVTGWWTPWTDDGRTGGNPEGEGRLAARGINLEALPKTSNFRVVPYLASMGVDAMDMGEGWGDQDLGASGIVLIESFGIALVSCKDGILYTINITNPGDPAPANLSPAATPANYAKLAAPPILYTYYDPTVNPAPANPSALNVLSANRTHHLHGTPVTWLSAVHGQIHFCGGENGNLRAWSVHPDKTSGYLACSAAVASASSPIPAGGMPGWSIFLSANGEQDGIVWAMIPYGDANTQITNGRLLAYDAADLSKYSDGSGEIVPLWDSQDWAWNFMHPKFNRPVAVNGIILMPTYNGQLLVLGLA